MHCATLQALTLFFLRRFFLALLLSLSFPRRYLPFPTRFLSIPSRLRVPCRPTRPPALPASNMFKINTTPTISPAGALLATFSFATAPRAKKSGGKLPRHFCDPRILRSEQTRHFLHRRARANSRFPGSPLGFRSLAGSFLPSTINRCRKIPKTRALHASSGSAEMEPPNGRNTIFPSQNKSTRSKSTGLFITRTPTPASCLKAGASFTAMARTGRK